MIDLLTPGSRLTLVGGKGGVGKTTAAAALALEMAAAGDEVVVLSVDPAHSLGDALEIRLGGEPTPVPGAPRLSAMEVDAVREKERFLGTGRGSILVLLERGTYLDREDAAGIVDLALPGLDELAAVFRLLDLSSRPDLRLVVDTAPTGHTLRLLDTPRLARDWLGALEAMEAKHRAVSLALTDAYRPDDAARFLADTAADLDRLSALLVDSEVTRFLLVTDPEPVVLAETRRHAGELEARGIALAGVVVNRAGGGVARGALGAGMIFVPEQEVDPRGVAGLLRFAASATPDPPSPPEPPPPRAAHLRLGAPFAPPPDRTLYLVGGKGGVGKSTAAAALALHLSHRGARPVLLLGTDPAGSLGDLLGAAIGPVPTPLPGAPSLRIQQIDAPAAWAAFRERYREDARQLFDSLAGGLSLEADRAVVERLVDLAPPGVDELMALLEVVDASEDRPYDPLVVDTAPTGHLLRLLELPDLALDWAHALLRLLLKYREVVGLGPLADRVLQLSRSLRSFRERLGDPQRSWFLVVARPESLAVPETARLLAGLDRLHVPAGALLVNRFAAGRDEDRARALVEAAVSLPCAAAPDLPAGPRGVDELSRFAESWRLLSVAPDSTL